MAAEEHQASRKRRARQQLQWPSQPEHFVGVELSVLSLMEWRRSECVEADVWKRTAKVLQVRCCALNRRAFIRLPQIFMSHQRRVWFLLVSRKSHRHSKCPQARILEVSWEVSRASAPSDKSSSGS